MLTPTVMLILSFILVAIVSFLFGLCWRERHNYTYDQVRIAFWNTFANTGAGWFDAVTHNAVQACWERFEVQLNETNR